MKLNRFNPGNIRVRGGSGGGGLPGGRGGGIGCGAIVIAAIAYFVFGADPMQTIGVVQGIQQGTASQQGPASTDAAQVCESGPYALEACNALDSLNQTWEPAFGRANAQFQQPTLHLYSAGVNTACGSGSASMGPFYCPGDQTIYIDTSFYDTMERQLGAGGDFARYYVMAHEYGHHIQKLTGVADQVRSLQSSNRNQANALQVRMELQSDCYAGVWAGKNRNLIEPGDFEEGMTAAAAIGDDRLTGGRVSAENFTHGTSAQRSSWLRKGMETGDENQCDTFTGMRH